MKPAYDIQLLAPAVEAVRRHLSELDDEMVPHALRAVQASSARRLPPPLAAAVLRALDSDPDLRAAAAAHLDRDLATNQARASAAFLDRPDGWETTIGTATSDSEERSAQATIVRLKNLLESGRTEVERLKSKLKVQESAREEETAKLRNQIAGLKSQLADQGRTDADETAALRAEIARLEEEAHGAASALKTAEGTVARLRSQLLKARRARPTETAASVAFSRDPVALARSLDMTAAAASHRQSPTEPTAQIPSGLTLPPGTRPDSVDAMAWVVKRSAPTSVVIDGYNVAWLLDATSFSSPALRNEVIRRAGLLRGASVAPMRVIVVFDSAHGQGEPSPPGPVNVRWAASADDEIRDLAETLGGDVVVVSTDREVQEGSAAHGALALWSEAFVAWTSR